MCIKILEAQNNIDPWEYSFLLTGGIVLNRENQVEKPVTWLSNESWDNVSELEKLPSFHGIIASFEQSPRDWQAWYTLFNSITHINIYNNIISKSFLNKQYIFNCSVLR
jgi:dynein heavy chain